jgi:uncharacterized protein involved in outer membrane biogenesis
MLRILLTLLAVVLALLVVALLVVTLARIPVNISPYKGLIEAQASKALGREVKVDGDVIVTTSLWPYFEIGGLRIASPPEFDTDDLVQMQRARVTIGLVALLERQVRIRSFIVEGLALNLVRSAEGEVNWATEKPAELEPEQEPAPASNEQPARDRAKLVVDELQLGDISVRFEDRSTQEVETFLLSEAQGAAPEGEPVFLDMAGVLLEEPYTVSFKATSLADFLAMTNTRVDLQVAIADTRMEFGGFTDNLGTNLRTELELVVEGAELASLNDLLKVDLPPLEDYRLSASLVAQPGQYELTGLDVRVKDSVLTGRALVDNTVEPPSLSVELVSKTIQLRDFDTGDWSPEEAEPESGEAGQAKPLSPESLRRLNADLAIRVDEVLSGPDRFGSGELAVTLQDGRLSIDPLKLQVNEQSLFLQVSVKPDRQLSDASLRVLVENANLGALIRLSRPDSDVGGVLNVDIDVQTSVTQFNNLLARANGYLDISGVPENLESGVVDLWAVNLLSSVVSSAVKGDDVSQVNCMLSRWSLENGQMQARQLAVDTSRIRICGDGDVDFTQRTLDLTVKPKAKRPEFFSLATPLRVRGDFDDFGIGMKGGPIALGTTAVGFVVSPITTPLQRLLREDLPQDGADICGLPIGPHEGELEDLPGC